MESSAALTAAAEAHAYGLTWAESEIRECWVGIHCDFAREPTGMPYSMRVDVSIPGHELVAQRVQHDDVLQAMGHSFEDIARQLKGIDPNINHAEYAVTVNGLLTPQPAPDKPPPGDR